MGFIYFLAGFLCLATPIGLLYLLGKYIAKKQEHDPDAGDAMMYGFIALFGAVVVFLLCTICYFIGEALLK